jgi:Fic family protein
MIDKELNARQKNILLNMELEKSYSRNEITGFFVKNKLPSLATLRRDILELYKLGFLKKNGKLKTTRYEISIIGMLHNPIIAHDYCATEIDNRNGNTSYNFSFFENIPKNIFTKKETTDLNLATKKFKEKSYGASILIQKKELERFIIELSWKSSKIEGNTYTLLDTELLLREGIEALGHSKEEATMIINHKKAFQYSLSVKNKYAKPTIRTIEDIHRLLTEGLGISFGLRSRKVGITGSKYIPLSIPSQINEALVNLCDAINKLENPYEKAFLALIGISYIQPFEDGNKRTARLFANAILFAYECAPLSYRNVNEINYRESILVFYEKNSISAMKDIFIGQYVFACENYLKF